MKLEINWKCNDTEVYVNGIYGGYIDTIGTNGAWYGNIYCQRNNFLTMEHFGIVYDKFEIIKQITQFIQDNADAVVNTCKRIKELNKY